MTTIIDMGGDGEKRFGYDFQSKKIYTKEQQKNGNKYVSVVGIGPLLGTVLYNSLSNLDSKISSLNWLIISTVTLTLLMILGIWVGVLLVERLSNWDYDKEIEEIDDESIRLLKELNDKNGMIILSVCTIVFGVAVAFPLGNLYVTSSDMTLWGMYMVSVALTTIGIMVYWFYQRQKRLRKLMISQIELKENNNN